MASNALNAALQPLRPHLKPLILSLPDPLHQFIESLVGHTCHKSLVLNLDVTDACLSLAVSKALGLGIIAMSSFVKVPQLLKILASKSGAGLSLLSVLLETVSYLITLAYNFRNQNPFSTYGEVALISAQNTAIALAIMAFDGQAGLAGGLVGALAAGGYALFAGPQLGVAEVVGMDGMAYLQAGAGALGIAAKVPQIIAIWRQGGTGQLSAFAVFTYLFGSLARIFTTLKEVDDVLILGGFVAGFALNVVLALQMIYYWNAGSAKQARLPQTTAIKLDARKVEEKRRDGGAAAATSGAAAKKGSTRRRG